jgi:hypothetical protein
MWKKVIKRGEKVGLELTRAERKLSSSQKPRSHALVQKF